MKKFILSLLTVCCFWSCSNPSKTIEGSLYFKLIDPFTLLLPEIDSTKANEILKQYKQQDKSKLRKDELYLNNWYVFLINNKLYQKKAVRIRKNDGKIALLFLKPIEYQKLANYNLDSLLENHTSVNVKAKAKEIVYDSVKVFDCENLIAIEEAPGITYWHK